MTPYTKPIIRQVFFDKLPKEINEWFFKEYTALFKMTCDTQKGRINGNYINTFDGFKHEKKDFNSYSPEIKGKVQIMLDYIFEVLASGSKDNFDYLIKWYANVAKGKKNQSILYMKGPEGIGKSTITDFFKFYVMGKAIAMC